MKPDQVKANIRIWWNDPEGLNSGPGRIVSAKNDPTDVEEFEIDDETVLTIIKDNGVRLETNINQLELLTPIKEFQLATIFREGTSDLHSLTRREILAYGIACPAKGVIYIDLTQVMDGTNKTIEQVIEAERNWNDRDGFIGWHAVYNFLARHPELLTETWK